VLDCGAAYDAELARHARRCSRRRARGAGPSLHPRVTEWHAWKSAQRKGAKSADAYLGQLRVLFPAEQPFHLGGFTREAIAGKLDALVVKPQTRNRYKAAASSFGKFLVRRGVLASNPVRDIEGFGEAPPRVVYYERASAKTLLAALSLDDREGAHRGRAGLCAFAAEWGAIERATVADLDLTPGSERFTVRGSKTDDRYRVVPLVRENRWLLSYLVTVSQACASASRSSRAPKAKPFAHSSAWRPAEDRRVGEDRFSQHTLHDWRSTHTVQLLRDGYAEQIAASHLGHKNTAMVRERYGVFIPTESDYRTTRTIDRPARLPVGLPPLESRRSQRR
jgi:integrase